MRYQVRHLERASAPRLDYAYLIATVIDEDGRAAREPRQFYGGTRVAVGGGQTDPARAMPPRQ